MPSSAGAVAAQPANTEASSAESSASLAARGAIEFSRRAAVSKVVVAAAISPRANSILPLRRVACAWASGSDSAGIA